MKVTITKDTKKWLTLEQAPIARRIIADMKQDETPITEYAAMAVNCIGNALGHFNWCSRVLEAKAEISGNRRIWNQYSDDSETLDVWIDFTARTDDGFIEGGAYLTDIWNIGGIESEELAAHMYCRIFEEVKR